MPMEPSPSCKATIVRVSAGRAARARTSSLRPPAVTQSLLPLAKLIFIAIENTDLEDFAPALADFGGKSLAGRNAAADAVCAFRALALEGSHNAGAKRWRTTKNSWPLLPDPPLAFRRRLFGCELNPPSAQRVKNISPRRLNGGQSTVLP